VSPGFQDTPLPSQGQDPTQILAEIRDIQREVLSLHQQAVARQRRLARFAVIMVIFLSLVVLAMLGNVFYSLRSVPLRAPPNTPARLPQP
jgi:hypothetical protein